jgi:regulator of protease activity HflC (stomatin/prohibitin superfamily)
METTSITNFDFSTQFNAAIEQKVTAEQNALTQKNRLAQVQYEAQQIVATANGQRDAAIASAEGQARQKILVAESEAKALELQKTQITPDLLKLREIEVQSKMADKWNGQLPMYNLGGNTLPILNIPTQVAIAQTTQ